VLHNNASDQKASNLRYNWNTGNIPVIFEGEKNPAGVDVSRLPALVLTNASGKPVSSQKGFTPPGELGLLLRSRIGIPHYAEMFPDR
jgi:hypothetical protein